MKVIEIVEKLDKLLRVYLGIDETEVRLHAVQCYRKQLIIILALPFKRHIFREPWLQFLQKRFQKTSVEEKEKLGLAVGKAVASHLTVSFEMPLIKTNKED